MIVRILVTAMLNLLFGCPDSDYKPMKMPEL